jgi:hypothetical protein
VRSLYESASVPAASAEELPRGFPQEIFALTDHMGLIRISGSSRKLGTGTGGTTNPHCQAPIQALNPGHVLGAEPDHLPTSPSQGPTGHPELIDRSIEIPNFPTAEDRDEAPYPPIGQWTVHADCREEGQEGLSHRLWPGVLTGLVQQACRMPPPQVPEINASIENDRAGQPSQGRECPGGKPHADAEASLPNRDASGAKLGTRETSSRQDRP